MQRLTPRRLKMIHLFRRGKTLEEIGLEFGISRQRVHQLLKNYMPLAGFTHKREDSGFLPARGNCYVYFVELWYDTKKGAKHHVYVGQTCNLKGRWEHYINLAKTKGAVPKLRDRNAKMRLAYIEPVQNRGEALILERKYKNLSMEEKLKLIEKFSVSNPTSKIK